MVNELLMEMVNKRQPRSFASNPGVRGASLLAVGLAD
jgi:hypothetical protein